MSGGLKHLAPSARPVISGLLDNRFTLIEREKREVTMSTKKIWAASVLTVALAAMTMGALAPAVANAETRRDDLWFHVTVNDSKDGGKVVLNLPLSMVEKAGGLIPKQAHNGNGKIRVNDQEMSKADLQAMWNDLRRRPDMTFLTVEETDGKVKMAKQGNYLVIHATDHGVKRENVQVRMPIGVVDALLSGPGEDLDIAGAMQALVRAGEGELVTVDGDDETVRMWIDNRAETR
jgi:hypothetical protein